MGLRYTEEWIAHGGFAISQTLPLRTIEYPAEPGGNVQKFFANLLPEGGARARVVRDLKIPDTDFDLLRAIGGDCAGALSLLPTDEEPAHENQYTLLVSEKLRQLVTRRGSSYVGISDGNRPRLSLAGAQDKCPVLLLDDQYFIPQNTSPSSHILKFEIPDYRNVPTYETFMTMLARSVGLPVVDVLLHRLGKTSYICIERYDRYRDDGGLLHRLHQEDFCQALGFGYQYKYEEDGGPTFARCYRLVQEASTEPAIDSQRLLRWQVFNVLSGNSDGHAKNISLLYALGNQTRLAPFYDLVYTRAIARIDQNLAFSVGGERNPSRVGQEQWSAQAEACGIRPDFLPNLVLALARDLLERTPDVRVNFEEKFGTCPALQRVEQVVNKQCTRTLKEA